MNVSRNVVGELGEQNPEAFRAWWDGIGDAAAEELMERIGGMIRDAAVEVLADGRIP